MDFHVVKMVRFLFYMTNTIGTFDWGKKKLMHVTWFEIDVTA